METDLTADAPDVPPTRIAGAPASVGEVIADRWFVTEVRRGGQAWVLIAEDLTQGRLRRAIKTSLAGPLAGDSELVMLLGLEPHPHVVSILDVIDLDSKPAVVLEYAPATLADLLSRHHGTAQAQSADLEPSAGSEKRRAAPLPAAHAEMLQQVCNGLAHLSRTTEVAHLDLKPSNVLVDESGRARIADFGLSQHIRNGNGRYPAARGGTWAYAAPEVLRREACDTRADIYSFGVLVYEACTGMLPYPFRLSRDPATQRAELLEYYGQDGPKKRSEELYWMNSFKTLTEVPVVPPDLNMGMFLSACLAPHRAERPNGFSELAVMLARALRRPAIEVSQAVLPEADRQRRELALGQALIRLGRFDEAVGRLNRMLTWHLPPELFDEALTAAQAALTGAGRRHEAAALGTWGRSR